MFPQISGEHLFVDKIAHEALIEVNEAGTVVVGFVVKCLGCGPEPPEPFIVNRPFVFVIEYNDPSDGNEHSIPLFMGRIVDPSAGGRQLPRGVFRPGTEGTCPPLRRRDNANAISLQSAVISRDFICPPPQVHPVYAPAITIRCRLQIRNCKIYQR